MLSSGTNRISKIVGILFIAVGIIFCGVGGGGYIRHMAVKQSMCEAEATITAKYPNGTEVEYLVDNEVYTARLNYSSDFFFVGDKLTIYYQEGNPGRIEFANPILFYLFFIIGSIIFIVGICAVIVYRKKNRKRKYLMQNGQKLYARIIRIECDYRYQRNYTYARKLICEYDSPEGTAHIFVSDPIWADLSENIAGNEIAVYIESGNFENYYVDLSSIPASMEIHIR